MPSQLSLEVVGVNGQRFKSAEKGIRAFAKKIGNIAAVDQLEQTVQREMKNYLDTVALAMRHRHSLGWVPRTTNPSGKQAGRLNTRSGALVSSIEDSVIVTSSGNVISGFIGSDLPYALLHEEGGTIRAKNVRYLTIPTEFALDSRGVPLRRRARDWPNTFVQTSKKGNLIIFQKRGNNIVPLYVLKKSVVIPPRLGLGLTLEVTGAPFVDRLFKMLLDNVNRGVKSRG